MMLTACSLKGGGGQVFLKRRNAVSIFRSISLIVLVVVLVMVVFTVGQAPTFALCQLERVGRPLTSDSAKRRNHRQQACGNDVERKGALNTEHGLPSKRQEEIRVSNGRLSMHVYNRPLISILQRLSMLQNAVSIVVKDQRIDRIVTVSFEDAPLDLALRAVLKDEDVLMLYGAGGSVLKAVIIYPNGQGDSIVKQNEDRTEHLMHALESSDEEVRARAVERLIKRLGTESQGIVLQALGDQSGDVREQALSGAVNSGVPLPVDTLIRLATTDPVPSVRTYAMEALADNLKGADAQERLSAIVEAVNQ